MKNCSQGEAYLPRWNQRNPQTLFQHLEHTWYLTLHIVSVATFTTEKWLPVVLVLNSSGFFFPNPKGINWKSESNSFPVCRINLQGKLPKTWATLWQAFLLSDTVASSSMLPMHFYAEKFSGTNTAAEWWYYSLLCKTGAKPEVKSSLSKIKHHSKHRTPRAWTGWEY